MCLRGRTRELKEDIALKQVKLLVENKRELTSFASYKPAKTYPAWLNLSAEARSKFSSRNASDFSVKELFSN